MQVPVTAVVGEKEKDSDSLAMRVRFGGTRPPILLLYYSQAQS